MLPTKRGKSALAAVTPLPDVEDCNVVEDRNNGPISSGVVTRVVSLDAIAKRSVLLTESARTITSAIQIPPLDSEHIKTTVGVGAFVGDYRIERLIGQGGMGAVYSAHHRSTGQPVAIKVLAPELLEDPNGVPRFMREAGLASKLQSPHTIRVMEVGTLQNGVPFIVMELLEGDTLHAFTVNTPNQQLPAYVAIDFIAQVCAAVGEAHDLGIVHRDLKLGNLFLANVPNEKRCVLKVLDFGLAKPKRRGNGEQSLTQAGGALFGTPYYMAPEQILGIRNIDARVDVWALGICLYTMITGRYPFHGDDPQQVCSRVLSGDYVAPSVYRSDLTPAIEAIIARCLSTSAANRYANANELASALRTLVPGRMDLVAAPSPPATMTLVSPDMSPRDQTMVLLRTSSSLPPPPTADSKDDAVSTGTTGTRRRVLPPSSQHTRVFLATPIPPPPTSAPAALEQQLLLQEEQQRVPRVRRDVVPPPSPIPPPPPALALPTEQAAPPANIHRGSPTLLLAAALFVLAVAIFATSFLLSKKTSSGRVGRGHATMIALHS